ETLFQFSEISKLWLLPVLWSWVSRFPTCWNGRKYWSYNLQSVVGQLCSGLRGWEYLYPLLYGVWSANSLGLGQDQANQVGSSFCGEIFRCKASAWFVDNFYAVWA